LNHPTPHIRPMSDWMVPKSFGGNHPYIAQGPLRTASYALFGSGSFFDIIKNARDSDHNLPELCQVGVPLINLQIVGRMYRAYWNCDNKRQHTLKAAEHTLYQWFRGWQYRADVEHYIGLSVFHANRVALTHGMGTVHDPVYDYDSRTIFSRPGYSTQKPQAGLKAIIALSTLYGLQLLALLGLAYYVITHPSWTDRLDSLAIARLVASMDPAKQREIADLECSGRETEQRLKEMDGLVGVLDDDHDHRNEEMDGLKSHRKRLALGASGLIERHPHQ
jgi:hypothetical protein